MINEIYVDNMLVDIEFPKKQFKTGFKIRCFSCEKLIDRKWFDNSILEKKYVCKKCKLINNNPMHDPRIKEKHNRIVKSESYRNKLSKVCTGKLNGFYGKTHTKKVIEKIRKSNIEYQNQLTEEDKQIISERLSRSQKNFQKENPEYYSKIKSKAAAISNKKQLSNSEPNKIELIVGDYLSTLGNFEFSIILDKYQFDFGNKDKKILIEVFGDYWHGNPNHYEELSWVQKKVKDRDIEKLKFALSNEFKLYVIWETEILSGEFKQKLRDLI